MKKLLILTLSIICTLSVVTAQEIPVVAPDSLKISVDSLMITADTGKIPIDTLRVLPDTAKVYADTVNIAAGPVKVPPDKEKVAPASAKISKNIIKFNITSALIKNYSLQYERVLSRGVSMALTFRMMPETNIPYTDAILRWAGITDPESQDIIENLITGNYTITPEIRFYTGKKKYGTGFYIALFYRYGQYTVNNAVMTFESDLGDNVEMTWSGNASSHSGGFMLGAQFALGKHMCLDWWILGPHFGISSGDVLGLSSIPLSETDQQKIEDELNGIDIPMFEQTVDVTSDKATMIFDGPWAGIRTGLSIGVKF